MRIVITGGGTAGHVTPLKSVVAEIKHQDPSVEVLFIAQKGDRFGDMIADDEIDDRVAIRAGKYRRYPDESVLQRLVDLPTHLLNIRDIFYTAGAVARSYRAIKAFKPDVVFGNGGYVSVPVGWAAKWASVPLVIHESDAKPGIATKLLSKNAHRILFGVPTKTTTINGKAAEYVGIPLREAFTKPPKYSQGDLKKKLGFDSKKPLVTISGSSLGAEAINTAVIGSIKELLKEAQIVHITGQDHFEAVTMAIEEAGVSEGYEAIAFTESIDLYFKASDMVVNRASATIFAELAVLGKPTILIPAPQLSDQLENAEILEGKGAVEIIDQHELEKAPELLVHRIVELLGDTKQMQELESKINALAKPQAAKDLADILLSYGDADGQK